MNIRELKKWLESTPCVFITKIFIKFELSNKSYEKKELTKFNDLTSFHCECMELNVVEWKIDSKKFNNTLTVKVFKTEYIKKLSSFCILLNLKGVSNKTKGD